MLNPVEQELPESRRGRDIFEFVVLDGNQSNWPCLSDKLETIIRPCDRPTALVVVVAVDDKIGLLLSRT